MTLQRLYALLISLYPRRFRQEFEDELREVFASALRDAHEQGHGAVIMLILREIRDLPAALLAAYRREYPGSMARLGGFGRIVRNLMAMLLVPILIATACTFSMWGYWFLPPSIDPMVVDFETVHDLSAYAFVDDGTVVDGDRERHLFVLEQATRYSPQYRIPVWAGDEGMVLSAMDATQHTLLPDLMRLAGWSLIIPDRCGPGWPRETFPAPTGFIVQGEDDNGNPLLLVSMIRTLCGSGNHYFLPSSDGYAYYEGVFRPDANGYTLVKSQTYRTDSAGLEGLEWPFWFLIGLILWSSIALFFKALNGVRLWLSHTRLTAYS